MRKPARVSINSISCSFFGFNGATGKLNGFGYNAD
jgi:hypothetical protein